jgi:hypothetical protein
MIAAVAGLAAVYAVAMLLLRVRASGRWAATHRAALVRPAVDAVVVLALVPPGPWSWAWVAAAGAVGVGVAGVVLRWPHLPVGRTLPTAGYVVLGALLVAATV